MLDVSIVVPTYAPGPGINGLVEELIAVLPPSHEIIIVDDGNQPENRLRLSALAASHGTTRLMSLRRNGGQQRATLAGVRSAAGRTIVTMDDDGAHPARLVPKMLAMISGHSDDPAPDLVYGVPDVSFARPLRRAGSLLNRSVFRLFLGVPPGISITSFRAFRTSLTRAPLLAGSRARGHAAGRPVIPPNLSAMLLGLSPRLGAIHYAPSIHGPSRLSLRSLITGMILLGVWWVPIGLIRRAFERRAPARSRQ
jgi:glycosyltransferase involved in cell wall biosynthesis